MYFVCAGGLLPILQVACPGAVIRNGTLQLPPDSTLRVEAPGVRFEGVTIRGAGSGPVAGGYGEA